MAISFLYTDLQKSEKRSIGVPNEWQIEAGSVVIGVAICVAIGIIVAIPVKVVKRCRKVNQVQVNPQNENGKLCCSSNSF